MQWSLRRGALGAAASGVVGPLLAMAGVVALTACVPNGQPSLDAAAPRGASVAFESIDGPPPAQFHELVQKLNEQAQVRRLAVVSREQPSAYRVRGYLAAEVAKDVTTVSWVWDVFDHDRRRVRRVSGTETAKGRRRGWNAVDEAMLTHIAGSSMDQLAAFLTSPTAAPGTPATAPAEVASVGGSDATPESAGIFPIFKPQADPLPTASAPSPSAPSPSASSPAAQASPAFAGPVPLPRSRPPIPAALSANKNLTLAAAGLVRH
jgi:hypothetical protein